MDHNNTNIPHQSPSPEIRTGTKNRKPYVSSSASEEVRHGQAIFYLIHCFDHEGAFKRDAPIMILAKVVCNLRNYYRQDKESTIDLIRTYFNPKCWDEPWSPQAVSLVWEYVEAFTPSLGLTDRDAVARQKAQMLQREVAYLMEFTVPGGRVLDKDLLKLFQEWNPDIEVNSHLFTRAVNAVTGKRKTPSNGKQYWVGFHIPTEQELEIAQSKAA